MENTPPEGRGVQIAEGGVFSNSSRLEAVYCHSFLYWKLPFKQPGCIDSIYKFYTLSLYKKECTMYIIQTRFLTQVKITFPPDVWILEDAVVSKEGGDFVVCGFIISEYLS